MHRGESLGLALRSLPHGANRPLIKTLKANPLVAMSMGETLPALTRPFAREIQTHDSVEELIDYNGSIGSVTFRLKDDEGMSQRRLNDMLPEGVSTTVIMNKIDFTTVYVNRNP